MVVRSRVIPFQVSLGEPRSPFGRTWPVPARSARPLVRRSRYADASLQNRQELQSVTEGVVHIEPTVPRQQIVWFDVESGRPQPRFQLIEVADQDPWMAPAGGLVVCVDPEVEFNPSVAKPNSTSIGQSGRFGEFFAAEHVAVEGSRRFLRSERSSDLHMMKEPRHRAEASALVRWGTAPTRQRSAALDAVSTPAAPFGGGPAPVITR